MDNHSAPAAGRGFGTQAAALFVIFFSIYSLTMQGVSTGGDARGMFLVTASIADRGSVLLDSDTRVVLAPCGDRSRFCSRFGIGQSLAQLPLYLIGKNLSSRAGAIGADAFIFFIVSLTAPLLSAGSCALVYLFIRRIGHGQSRAVFLCALYALGTLAWHSAKAPMSEALQTFSLLGCAYFSYTHGRDGKLWRAAASGFLLGWMIAAKALLVIAAPALAIYFLHCASKRGAPWRAAFIFFIAASPLIASVPVYNYLRFGNALDFGYYRLADRDSLYKFSVPLYAGLHGLLFSPGKGLFIYIPAAWAAAFSARAFYSARKAEALLCAGAFAPLLIAYAKWNQWHGDYSWGPRFLAPAMPFIALALAEGIAVFMRGRPASRKLALLALLAVSVFIQTLGAAGRTGAYLTMAKSQPPFQLIHRPGDLLLRDDMLNQHFIPEFSPIAAHWWMVRHTLLDRNLPEAARREAMQSDFPWKTLLPRGTPPDPLWCEGLDFWQWYMPRLYPGSGGFVKGATAALAALLALASSALFVSLYSRRHGPHAL